MSRSRPPDAANILAGTIGGVACMGASTLHRVRLESGKIMRVSQTGPDRVAPGADGPVFLNRDTAAAIVLTT